MKRSITFIARNTLQSSRKLLTDKTPKCQPFQCRHLSQSEVADERSHLFSLEKKRQMDAVGRIEKIEVKYVGLPEDTTLIMNKDLSTPFDCARHLGAVHMQKSALALLDGRELWDMHRPLPHSCTLQLLHYLVADPLQVNRAFWRTCSFLLGAAVASAFKDQYRVLLHSFPSPDVRSGSFVYDAEVEGLGDWQPDPQELRALSAEVMRRAMAGGELERLTVEQPLAALIFRDNPHKTQQIPHIAAKNQGRVTLYRSGTHVDISKGPMVADLRQVGRATVSAVHPLGAGSGLYRFQGVALPAGFVINHMAYRILEERAAKLNPARSPLEPMENNHAVEHAVA